ncbi:MAG: GNAT family N-acetyltransferase [Clostridia bacterium]|nr:GNAT family N-acetyltransferase [Clostridia bacterium]
MIELKVIENGYEILSDGVTAGVIKFKDFWDGMPYLNLIKLTPEYRRKGIGSEAMRLFEDKMRRAGNKAILLSTQADEEAQHFYRKTGYKECGCLILEDTPYSQPMEMFFIKTL